jgi:uncharacterized cupin superfamily protein
MSRLNDLTIQVRMPPHWEHYPEHDHAADNEEELYILLEGSGTLYAEGHTYPRPGLSGHL